MRGGLLCNYKKFKNTVLQKISLRFFCNYIEAPKVDKSIESPKSLVC